MSLSAQYDNEGRRTSLRYPTHYTKPGSVYVANLGRKLLYGFDSAGRLTSVNPETGGSLISSVSYNAAWQVTSWRRVWEGVQNSTETFQFNDAGQLTRQGLVSGSTLVDVEYRYPAANNDGRLWQRKNHVSGEEVTYQYDELGRLSAAATTSSAWGLSWTFDGFGNRLQQTQTKGSPPQHSVAVNGLTNRMVGQSYDANGNMLITGLSYDVDNRLAGDGVYSYRYSSMNQRMRVSNATGAFAWFYGFEGEMLAVYKLEKENGDANKTWPVLQTARERVYAMGRLIRMGTSDVVVDRGASVIRHGTSNLAYYPYGEEQGGASANDRAKYATYTRDASTGLDYAWNRMYKVEWGRFTSADPFSGSGTTGNPASWNRYSYVSGDPVNRTDRSGLLMDQCADPVDSDKPYCLARAGGDTRAYSFLGTDTGPEGPVPVWYSGAIVTGKGGGGPPILTSPGNVTALQHARLNLTLRGQTQDALSNLSTQCQQALAAAGIDMGNVGAVARNTEYYNAATEGHLLVRNVTGYRDKDKPDMNLTMALSSSIAVVLPGFIGTSSNTVVVSPGFFSTTYYGQSLQESQGIVLTHEALHTGTGWSDRRIAANLGLGANLSAEAASIAISQWLDGCQ